MSSAPFAEEITVGRSQTSDLKHGLEAAPENAAPAAGVLLGALLEPVVTAPDTVYGFRSWVSHLQGNFRRRKSIHAVNAIRFYVGRTVRGG